MSDLIDRQQAITALAFAKETGTMKCGELKGVIEVLNRLPSAQPKLLQPWEVLVAQAVLPQPKMGKWISLDDFRGKYNENGYKCSECDEHSDYKENFCPHCGADMRGEQYE